MNNIAVILKRINAERASSNISEACKIAEDFLLKKDDLNVWREYAWLLIQSNEQVKSIAIYRNLIKGQIRLNEWELAEARTMNSMYVLDNKHNIAYMHIPKCGSSTLKDLIHYLNTNLLKKEFSHTSIVDFYKVLNRNSLLSEDFQGWERLLVVRDPIERLRSYYAKNIISEGSLAREALGLSQYMSLSTRPSYSEVLVKFNEYRSCFKDFRHHTNSVVSMAGSNPNLYTKIISIHDIDKFIYECSKKFNITIPIIRNMKTSNKVKISESDIMMESVISEFYKSDYEAYGKYF